MSLLTRKVFMLASRRVPRTAHRKDYIGYMDSFSICVRIDLGYSHKERGHTLTPEYRGLPSKARRVLNECF